MDPTHRPAPPGSGAPLPLRQGILAALPATVDVPRYDRSALCPSVVHFGVGNFHRAHQAAFFDDLARLGHTGWGVVGVNLNRRLLTDVLDAQDGLYSLVVRGERGDQVRVVGALTRWLFAPEAREEVLDALADPRTRLVTLTITGSAYLAGDEDGPAAPATVPGGAHPAPRTAFEHIVEGLHRRRAAGLPPFTVLSCDNMPDNGTSTRDAVVWTARLRDPELARWIERRVSFPGSMVDRITPQTTPEAREGLARRFGVQDGWPVVTEPFSQWVVEDDFCNGRPPLEEVGVRFVADVRPYELMKTRLLNGAHSALGHLATLAGFRTGDEAMASPVVRGYLEGYLAEAAAVLPPVPGIDLDDYRRTLVERIASPRLADQLPRLCRRGSTKVPSFVLPSLRLALEAGSPGGHLALAVAAWIRSLRGHDWAGTPVEVEDPLAARLQPLARACSGDPRALLAQRDVFGDAGTDTRVIAAVEGALRALDEAGPLGAATSLREGAAVLGGSAA